ncbi:MAG TPA: hypothetical protein PLF03_01545 [Candidatus Omnitrophota bacterium]|nr:hypothetical protein [Candidatus Omnitrophota bacterium]
MGKKAKKQKVAENKKKVSAESLASPKEGIVMHAGASRNELMMTAKERGVKNFRVLNKQELSEVLKNIGDQKAVDAIVAGAVARWKAGWGKKKVSHES